MIPLMGNILNRLILRHREGVSDCQGLRVGQGSDCTWGWNAFWGDENVLKLMKVMDAQLDEYTKNH